MRRSNRVANEDPSEHLSRQRESGTLEISSRSGHDTPAVVTAPSTLRGGSWRGKSSATAAMTRESATGGSNSSALPSDDLRAMKKKKKHTSAPLSSPVKAVATTQLTTPSAELPKSEAPEHKSGSDRDKHAKSSSVSGKTSVESDKIAHNQGVTWSAWLLGRQNALSQRNSDSASQTAIGSSLDEATGTPPSERQAARDVSNHSQSDSLATSTEQSTPPSRSSWFGSWKAEERRDESQSSMTSAPLAELHSQNKTLQETSHQKSKSLESASLPAVSRPLSASWAFWSRERQPTQETASLEAANISSQAPQLETPPQQCEAPDSRATISAQDVSHEAQLSRNIEQGVPEKESRGEQAISKEDGLKTGKPIGGQRSGGALEQKTRAGAGGRKPPNIVLPNVTSTLPLQEIPGYLAQIARVIRRTSPNNSKHLYRTQTMPSIKKAVAIGVHGYFPAPILQKILGPPTGTSVRFAQEGAGAIERWMLRHGRGCTVEKIALEGQGMIAARVDLLWKLLINEIDKLQEADLVFFCCHSQGVPVGMILAAKLLQFGCLRSTARVGICAMAGVNLGPFPTLYQPRVMGASMAELFEFSKAHSDVSKAYVEALDYCLRRHVRVSFTGSIDDQLVPMESSVMSTVTHPYIFRSVFVDGRIHAPSFITHLVGFALKLRNRGVTDHGLVCQLSNPLAGSLYGGEGHSRIYEDGLVYDTALAFTLETATLYADGLPSLQVDEAHSKANPFFLPWAMRGILEEELVKNELKEESMVLLRQFEEWRPQTKLLNDVRFRLEVIRSKL